MFIISCSTIEEDLIETTYYNDCFYELDQVNEIDLFEGYMTLKLDYAYVPDFNFRDSLLNDYYFLKFSSNNLNGIYVITDAVVRFKLNKVQPYDSISEKEYPFSENLLGENVCVFLDLVKAERCDC